MATIRKRTRYHATLRSSGCPVQAKSFGQESEARAWLRVKKRELAEQDESEELSTDLREKTTYQAIVRLVGWPPEYATFGRLTDARKWTAQTEAAIREGRHFRTGEARKHSVGDLIDRYRTEVLSRKPQAKRRNQEHHLEWWTARIGSRLLADVTPAIINEHRTVLLNEITIRGAKRAPATVNRYLASLSVIFNVAVREWEWIEQSPMRKVSKLKEPRGRVRVLSESERHALLEACRQSSDPRLYPLAVLALSTGARQGELLRLRWRDVDFSRCVAVLEETKNDERRALPLTGHALELLRDKSKVRRLDTDLIFAGESGKAAFPRKAWETAVVKAKLEDFRFHDLRHSAASYLAMNGATLAEIADVLGHKTLAMVKRYSHLTEQHTSRVVARMNEQIFR